jgi:hypothetical protein
MEIMIDGIFLLQLVQFVTAIVEHVHKRFGIDLEAQLLNEKEYMLLLPASILERSNWYFFLNRNLVFFHTLAVFSVFFPII